MSVRFVNDAHWNELGHERIASLLVEPVAEVLRARMAREAETATPNR
jgi:hypothetical protein